MFVFFSQKVSKSIYIYSKINLLKYIYIYNDFREVKRCGWDLQNCKGMFCWGAVKVTCHARNVMKIQCSFPQTRKKIKTIGKLFRL